MTPRRSFNRLRWLPAALAALAIGALVTTPVLAGQGDHLRIEEGWYAGHKVTFFEPAVYSADPNGAILGCFGLGPDMTGIARPAAPLYVIFDASATQDHCDGQPDLFRHDHILSVAPGDPGYTGAWRLVFLVETTPGSIDLATNPVTTAAEVKADIADGSLTDVTSVLAPGAPILMMAPVIGGS